MAFKVEAIKLTEDPRSTKVVYSKNDKTYLRTGEDNFTVGIAISKTVNSLASRWGYRRVTNPPEISDGKELVTLLKQGVFSMGNDGTAKFR